MAKPYISVISSKYVSDDNLELEFQIEGCSEVNSVSVLVNSVINDV